MKLVIVEQANVAENDISKVNYKTILGNTSFNEFILSRPSGAYTGMRTVQRHAIVALSTHMQRLTNSISSIKFEGKTDSETLNAKESLSSFQNLDSLEKKLIPLLKKGLDTYYEKLDSCENPSEAKVSVLLTYSFETHQPYFAAHITKLATVPSDKRVKATAKKVLRNAPEVKDSQWVRERQELEKNKPDDINEVILMDDEEQFYEGMSSNFLVVANSTVYCAPLEHILLGSILKIVTDLCKSHDIPFKWEFPKLQDAKEGKWEGCCVTSTSRLLLPVETLIVENERIEFQENSPILELLRSEVAKEIYNAAFKV